MGKAMREAAKIFLISVAIGMAIVSASSIVFWLTVVEFLTAIFSLFQ